MSERYQNRNNSLPEDGRLPTIGVLAIQGDFIEHRRMLDAIGTESKEIRLPKQLEGLDGLIIPGGESTTIVQLIDIYGFRNPLRKQVKDGLAVWGTCAGMIVLARKLLDKRPEPLGIMDIEVSRNAFGRQVDSFETSLDVSGIPGPPIHALFIRAPLVTNVGANVQILAQVDGDKPVAVREGKLLATAFHPELTNDTRVHKFFSDIASA